METNCDSIAYNTETIYEYGAESNGHGGKRNGAGRKAVTPRPPCPRCNSPVVAHSRDRWRCKSPLCRCVFLRSGQPKSQGREREISTEAIEDAKRAIEAALGSAPPIE
jgi:ribosomal protein S27AE